MYLIIHDFDVVRICLFLQCLLVPHSHTSDLPKIFGENKVSGRALRVVSCNAYLVLWCQKQRTNALGCEFVNILCFLLLNFCIWAVLLRFSRWASCDLEQWLDSADKKRVSFVVMKWLWTESQKFTDSMNAQNKQTNKQTTQSKIGLMWYDLMLSSHSLVIWWLLM